jgi:hypothetical protein
LVVDGWIDGKVAITMNMKDLVKGIIAGAIAGAINLLPLLFASDIEATVLVSTVITWILVGLFIAATDFKLPRCVHGIIVALLISLPTLVYIFPRSLFAALWTTVLAILFGAILGIILKRKKTTN